MNGLRLSFFGRFQACLNGESIGSFRTQKVQALLIFLAATPNNAHRREMLMTLLWPGMPDQSARANLRQILFLLRQLIPDIGDNGTAFPLLIANRDTIQLNPQARVDSDTAQFDSLLKETQTHNHVDLSNCDVCHQRLTSAIALYQGDFLADFYLDDSNEFEDWAEITRQSYRRKALDALETLTAVSIHQKAFAGARAYGERQLKIDNLRESAYRQLMEILALSGQRAEALAMYEDCRKLFAAELGMSPSSRMTELYEKIRMGDLRFDLLQVQGIRGYEIKEEIGSGAYGIIHRAIQPAMGREVAVKIIRRQYANDPAFIRRFEKEAQTIARLEHPHIVPLYDYWRESDGAYLVMRLLRGGNLLSALQSGPWQPDRVHFLLDQLAPALDMAHRQSIVHQDIKPANILFDEEGNAYLSDFGIAKDLYGNWRTRSEADVWITPDYISPEQLQDEPVSPQTDIYSLGAVLYEMLTGEKPFSNASFATLIHHHMETAIPRVSSTRPDVPAELDEVIQRATSKQPSDRFSNVHEFAEAFHSAIKDHHIHQIAETKSMVLDVHIPNPYKGLRPYQEADALDFFGRETLTNQLINKLAESRFLAVVGPSGSGKSSIVKAGLIPALRQGALPGSENWFIAEMTPGTHPLEEMELALWPIAVDPPSSLVEPMEKDSRGMLRTIRRILPGGEDSQIILVIDQFEDLFTMVEDEGRRNHFLNSLWTALNAHRSPLRVILTLRADFYDRPLQFQPLAELFKQHTELVLPLTRDELIWAIQEPARKVGVKLENGLLADIVADMGEEPGALPLLQYALTELFNDRHNGKMTRQAYAKIGGVLGAMTRRADEINNKLTNAEQQLVRQLFLQLVTVGEGDVVSRRRVRLSELQQLLIGLEDNGGESILTDILDAFGNARLITFDHDPVTREPTVEVAHESLLTKWARPLHWVNESRNDIRLQRMLATFAADWENAGWDESYLLHGARLSQFDMWQQDTNLILMPPERALLSASLAAQSRKAKEETDRRQQELETAQQLAAVEQQRAVEQALAATRLRQRAWLLTGALFIVVILAGYALFAGQRALNNEAIAERNAVVSQSLALASGAQAALADNNTDLALSLAMAANQIVSPPAFAQRVLYDIALGPGSIRQISGGGGWRWAMDVYPSTHMVASGADDMLVILWDYTTGEEIMRLEGEHNDSISDVVFTPDGRFLLSGAYDDWMVLWDVNTGKAVRRMFNPTGDVNGLDISPDGQMAIAGTEHGTATLWDLQTGNLNGELIHTPEDQILPAVFNSAGSLAATGSEDGSVIIWNLASQTELHKLQVMDLVIFALNFSPNGEILAVGGQSDKVWLYEVETGQLIGSLSGHPDWVFDVDFSSDGSQLLVSTRDGAVMLWQIPDQKLLQTMYGKTGRILNVAFVDERTAISSASTGDLRVWSLAEDRLLQTLSVGEFLISMAQSPDGRLAALGLQNSIQLINLETGQFVRTYFLGRGGVTAMAFSPDGKWLLAGTLDGPSLQPIVELVLLDANTGQAIRHFEGHTQRIHQLVFSPDGKSFLSVSDDKQVISWDVNSGEIRFSFSSPDDTSNSAVFSPDGAQFAAGFGTFRYVAHGTFLDNSIRLWNTNTGEQLAELIGHEDAVVSLAYSSDGRSLLSGSIDTSVRLWDITSGRMVRRFDGHKSGVMSVAFSANDRYAVSGSQDGTLIVWDVETGDLLRQISGHEGVVNFVNFSQDSELIRSASEEGKIKLWRPIPSLDHLIAWIKENRFVPPLACDLQLKYGLTKSCEEETQ
jgi:WD40 repeat protein/serine/threonine protein kinase/DNA-binding SARP family transcriptional activator